jgi:hypothetical protein
VCGIHHALFLVRLGRHEEAQQLSEQNRAVLCRVVGPDSPDVIGCDLLLSDLARQHGDSEKAHALLAEADKWARVRDAPELLCWSLLINARIALADSQAGDEKSSEAKRKEALVAIEEGLRIARDCGYGIHHIDLLTSRARIRLLQADADGAEHDARTALFGIPGSPGGAHDCNDTPLDESSPADQRGIFPPKDSGWPTLLAATHPECGYAWGEGDARQVLAEALLLRASGLLDRDRFAPKGLNRLPASVQELITRARTELTACLALRERIEDPKVHETQAALKKLEQGVLVAQDRKSTRLNSSH